MQRVQKKEPDKLHSLSRREKEEEVFGGWKKVSSLRPELGPERERGVGGVRIEDDGKGEFYRKRERMKIEGGRESKWRSPSGPNPNLNGQKENWLSRKKNSFLVNRIFGSLSHSLSFLILEEKNEDERNVLLQYFCPFN